MNMKNKKINRMFIVLAVVIGLFLTYFYVIERCLAIKYINSYMREQGVTEDIIESKNLLKDWKMGGYKMIVYYSDNKGVEYEYTYNITTHRKYEERKYNVVDLYVYKDGQSADNADVKYPRLY